MTKAHLLTRAAALCAAVIAVRCAPALAAGGQRTPLDLGGAAPSADEAAAGGGSLVRTIVGLAIVIGVIYGIAWVLRQVKQSRSERASGGLASVASVPLGSGRALHLVRAGNELVLVGVGDHGVTPVRSYSEQEALAAGLVDEWGELVEPAAAVEASAPAARPLLPSRAGRPALRPQQVVQTMRKLTVRR